MPHTSDLLVFSHLRWDFVFQRPQHLLSRLAAARRVIFVEEPVHDGAAAPYWRRTNPCPNVLVCRPCTPTGTPGFSDEQMPALRTLVGQLLREERIESPVLWFYTPMALPLAEGLPARAVVYDCMDELSAFRHAPPQLLQRESELLARADVVFTGGPSLYRAKKDRHPHMHCFPSSVDAKHFAQARGAITEPADQAGLPHPRLGYFGVIDERMDLPLLDALAQAHPDWQVVLVGPVVKIDPASLPRRANLHFLGQRDYGQLPAYLAGWDVCLLPFARNEATRFISPTKTLEYMAAERPIVSTPITDVAEPYGEIVRLGDTPEAFVAACEQVLAAGAADHAGRVDKMRAVLAGTSWDATARAMAALVDAAAARRQPPAADGALTDANAPRGWATMRGWRLGRAGWGVESVSAPVVVIGAGPTGLSAAYHLEDALLLEREGQVGGWCRSVEANGFLFDFAGHIMFSNDPYVHELYRRLLGDNVHWQDREAWIYGKGVHTRYPFQGALYGLPPQVIKECIVGAIEARFGSLKKTDAAPPGQNGSPNGNGKAGAGHHRNGHHGNGHAAACHGDRVSDCCADGVLESTAPLGRAAGAASPDGPRPTLRSSFTRFGAPASPSTSPSPTTASSGPCPSARWKPPGSAAASPCPTWKR